MTNRVEQQLGNYRPIRLLGQGGFADIYLGEHTYLKTFAAIKVLHAQLAPADQEAFYNEARTIARLKHPNIVRVLEFGVESYTNTPYLVIDYTPNGTLRQRHPRGTVQPPSVIVPYVKQLAAGLQYAHEQKLVHRDIKPENMFVGPNNEVLLSDFGSAIIAQIRQLRGSQDIAGTVTYMAPEQLQGKPGPASNQYALAVVVYEWLSGTLPFSGSYIEVAIQQERAAPPPLREKVPTISPYVEQVVLTALAKEPQQRFGSVQAFANALAQASTTSPPILLTQPPKPRPVETVSSNLPPLATTTPTPPSSPGPQVQRSAALSSYPSTQPVQQGLLPRLTGSRGMAILLAVLALLVIAVGTGIIYYMANVRPATLHAQATAQSEATGVTVTATATLPQTGYAQAVSGSPAFNDPLVANDSNNWDSQSITGTGTCKFTGGAYHISIDQGGQYAFCLANSTNFSNFTIQVRMTVIAGDMGGIVFRANNGSTSSSLYFFGVGQDGSYGFGTYTSSIQANSSSTSASSQTTDVGTANAAIAVKQGLNQVNVLTVVAHGSTITFYANGLRIDTVSDSSFSSGAIGLYAFDNMNTTEVTFSNLQVWQA